MTQHDDRIPLRQILDFAVEAVELAEGHKLDDFEEDRMWCLAMERLVLNVGEAARRLTHATTDQLPQIP